MNLDIEQITRLIANGESLTVEFKSDRRAQFPDKDIYESIVCFANAQGGVLLIGVEDDGTITGLNHNRTNRDPNQYRAAIFNNTVPNINTRVSIQPLESTEILVIEVDAYPQVCATIQGKCLRRIDGANGPECRPYYPYEHISRLVDLGVKDYSAQIIEQTSWDDLDVLEFERLRQVIAGHKGDTNLLSLDNEQLAQALRLVESQDIGLQPNIAGLLLIGKQESLERFLPGHHIAIQVIDTSGEISVNDWLRHPLTKAVGHIERRFESLNTEREVEDGGFLRFPIPDFAPSAFREAVMNALLHRDYSRMDAVHIQFHPDHLSISNPGGFLEGITLSNLLVHEPKPRNPRLAEVLRRLGLVEITGRGIDKIYMGQLQYGRPLPDYTQSDSDNVRLLLQGGDASLEMAKFVRERSLTDHPLGLDELLILNHLQYVRRTTLSEIADITQRGEPHARTVIEKLVENGFVEARGQTKGRTYHLAASLYRQLGEPAGYLRQHGFDRVQQETMVMQYAKTNGRVTRKDVMDLCRLSGPQATDLLGRLESEKRIIRRGAKRGTFYEPV